MSVQCPLDELILRFTRPRHKPDLGNPQRQRPPAARLAEGSGRFGGEHVLLFIGHDADAVHNRSAGNRERQPEPDVGKAAVVVDDLMTAEAELRRGDGGTAGDVKVAFGVLCDNAAEGGEGFDLRCIFQKRDIVPEVLGDVADQVGILVAGRDGAKPEEVIVGRVVERLSIGAEGGRARGLESAGIRRTSRSARHVAMLYWRAWAQGPAAAL